ncbi:MAG: outer membrane protein assembly factor BamC [Arsenophonus endosymbiont of Dermacentor nuttalli]
MAKLLHNSKVIKLAGLSLAVLLVACTTNQRHKRQVSGGESYLNTPPLKKLTIPEGMSLPLENGEYDIPPANQNGTVGKALDIRPPIQILSLLSYTQIENSLTASRLFLSNTAENSALWSQINYILQQKAIKVEQNNEPEHSLITDWITWPRGDEDIPLQTRQKIQLDSQNNQIVITVTNEGMKQGEESISDPLEIQRYNILMLNELIDSINKLRNSATSSDVQGRYTIIDVQSGSDSSGLPQIIVCAPYDVVWERLPSVLESIGIQVGDRSRASGAISLTYNGMNNDDWQAIGVNTVPKGDYKLQVGDVNNRTSLQFVALKGTTLTQKQNDAMVAVLKAAFSKTSSN